MKTDQHHQFSQGTRNGWRQKKYGSGIHDPLNVELVGHNRHMSGKVMKISEREFCIRTGRCECRYCKNQLSGYLCNPERDAKACRGFNFDREKYEEMNERK